MPARGGAGSVALKIKRMKTASSVPGRSSAISRDGRFATCGNTLPQPLDQLPRPNSRFSVLRLGRILPVMNRECGATLTKAPTRHPPPLMARLGDRRHLALIIQDCWAAQPSVEVRRQRLASRNDEERARAGLERREHVAFACRRGCEHTGVTKEPRGVTDTLAGRPVGVLEIRARQPDMRKGLVGTEIENGNLGNVDRVETVVRLKQHLGCGALAGGCARDLAEAGIQGNRQIHGGEDVFRIPPPTKQSRARPRERVPLGGGVPMSLPRPMSLAELVDPLDEIFIQPAQTTTPSAIASIRFSTSR